MAVTFINILFIISRFAHQVALNANLPDKIYPVVRWRRIAKLICNYLYTRGVSYRLMIIHSMHFVNHITIVLSAAHARVDCARAPAADCFWNFAIYNNQE